MHLFCDQQYDIACQNPMVTPNSMILWDSLNSKNWGSLAIKRQSCWWSWVCPKITRSEGLDTSIYLFLTPTYPFIDVYIYIFTCQTWFRLETWEPAPPIKWFHLLLDPSGILGLLIWRHLHILGGIDLACTALTKTNWLQPDFFLSPKNPEEKNICFFSDMGNRI